MDSEWRTSSHSGAAGECVEACAADGRALMRDSKHPDGALLDFPVGAWRALLAEAHRL
ncbi:DUF397 domain-containing protein [Nocardiopsis sediminis]|uniref:DUF397 domain-containing protein n=1 Tax=Nocardiopsis sediminis TaxID=1778267 RepID=A0ABV8FLY0_9ACTN